MTTTETNTPWQLPAAGLVPGLVWFAHLKVGNLHYQDVETALATDRTCPADWLVQLAHRPSPSRAVALARNTQFPPQLLGRLFTKLSPVYVLRAVVARLDCPSSVLRRVSHICRTAHAGDEVFRKLAAHPNLPADLLAEMVDLGQHPRVVAQNPACSADLLAKLWRRRQLTAAVAANPSLPPELCRRAETSVSDAVMGAYATNPAASPTWLAKAAETSWLHEHLLRNPACPRISIDRVLHDIEYLDADLLHGLAKNPACPPDALEALAYRPERELRRLVADHRNTPLATLERLAVDEYDVVVETAARNPNLSVSTLERLAAASHDWVQVSAWSSPRISVAALLQAPAYRVMYCSIPAAILPAVDVAVVRWAIGVVPDWNGTLGDLLDAAQLLNV